MITTLFCALAPAESTYLGIPGPLLHGLLLAAGLLTFGWILWRRLARLGRAAPDPRLDHVGRRLGLLVRVGLFQSRQPRYLVAGVLHILLFGGFLVLSLRSLTLMGEGFRAGFTLPGLSGRAGEVYASIKDWTALVVLLVCVIAVVRRLAFHPARYDDRLARRPHGHEAYVILGLISTLMIADALYDGAAIAARGGGGPSLPLATAAASVLGGLSPAALDTFHQAGFWLHNVVLLGFLCYLPVSKHFHVVTALPNVFLGKIAPAGRVKPPRYDVSDLDAIPKLGVARLEDFTWKHLLDFYTCTDCGRCSDHCPAYATGTPLSPRMISIKCRDLAYATVPIRPGAQAAPDVPLVGDVLSEEEIWACTTCGACEEACPVLIEYVDKIVDLRRHLVDEGRVPATLQKALSDVERKGNPYGKMPKKRGAFAAATDGAIQLVEEGEDTDLLFFADSCTAYDPRIQQVAAAFGRALAAAGARCGTMGADETDSGHEARRMGEEGLFEVLREQNLEALGARTFREVVTCDPHAMNALRNDYAPAFEKPVRHHSQVLDELMAAGKLPTKPLADGRTYTFHDPCYLGRQGGEYDAPRRVLERLGVRTVEMERSRNRSFCCGGGSLYLFYEGPSDRRMAEVRLDMAQRAGADVVVTACPFCLINLEDAVKTSGRSERMEVLDLAELVARGLDDAPGA